MKTIEIGACIPNPQDATNWYRGTGPLAHLRRHSDQPFHVELMREWSASSTQMKDVAFFQRPSSPQELQAIKICKRVGRPVIVDYDDLLFDVPNDNPAYRAYMTPDVQKTIVEIIQTADCVWVSTKEIKRCFQISQAPLNKRVYVIPNALDETYLAAEGRLSPPPEEKRRHAVMWRGSPTHTRDVMEYTGEIAYAANKYPKTTFVFAGWDPFFLINSMGPTQAICSGPLSIGEFMDFLYATSASIGMVPLHSSRFNKCKSNIAWLEMTWAGAAVLVPDWEEWQVPGVVSYRNEKDFFAGLVSLIEMRPDQRAHLNKMSWDYIQKNLLLSKVNHLREKTILACLSGDLNDDKNWPSGWERLHDPDEKVDDLSVMELA